MSLMAQQPIQIRRNQTGITALLAMIHHKMKGKKSDRSRDPFHLPKTVYLGAPIKSGIKERLEGWWMVW